MSADASGTGTRILRFAIPLGGLLLAVMLVAIALTVAPDDNSSGFQISGEISRACLGLAATLVGLSIVSFGISEYSRLVDVRQVREDKRQEELTRTEIEGRRLLGELRSVHHAVKTAQLR